MQFKFQFQKLTITIFVIAILNIKLTLSFYHKTPLMKQTQHLDLQQDDDISRNKESESDESEKQDLRDHQQHVHHQHYFNDAHITELAESAKDPKNLRNGIYHDGAITYDLGLPNYEILNPYDPPEIITSDHPQYHEHLNHIKKTNNYTIEDFGLTPIPDIEATTTDTLDFTTTTEMPEITTVKQFLAKSTKSSEILMKKYKNMKSDIEKHLSKTKEKLRILNDELIVNNRNRKVSTSSNNNNNDTPLKLRKYKKQRLTSVRFPQHLKSNRTNPVHEQHFISNNKYAEPTNILQDLESIKSFYGQSILLPVDYMRPPHYFYRYGNQFPLPQPHNDPHVAYSSIESPSDLSSPSQYRLYRKTSVMSSKEEK